MSARRRAGARGWAARLTLFGVGLFAAAAGCHGRSPSPYRAPAIPSSSSPIVPAEDPDPSRPHVAELDLTRGAPEVVARGLLGPARDRSFADLIQRVRELGGPKDARTKGVIVRFGGASMGFARAQELAEALARLRARGLPVVCHADELSNSTYWVAANGCDRIWVSPAGGVETIGIAGQVLYGRKLLSELKVDVDMLQVGRFKGASEPLTRDGPSDEARESLMGTLRSMRKQWLDGVGKRLPKGAETALFEQGPYSPEEAKTKGLIDQVGYFDEARSEAQSKAGVDQTVARFGPGARAVGGSSLVGLVRVLSGAGSGFDLPHVTLVRASGSIAMRSSSSMLSGDSGISEQHMAKVLDDIAKDRSARAVVLRIDSPGGSALASDLIWHRLMELRKTRPVVVSIGDMAASGGYYLACAGTRVMAEPTSIVGSIGVVGGKLSVGRALEHIGVHAETFPASEVPGAKERAAYLSAVESWDQATRDRLLATMTSVYDLFVRRVAEGRALPAEKVGQFAEGRIFAASDAIGLGMVDELGGVERAIAHALKAAGLPEDAPVRVVGEESGIEQLLGIDDDEASEEARASVLSGATGPTLLRQVAPDFLPFAGALAPVLTGEHALVAVPFAFLVR